MKMKTKMRIIQTIPESEDDQGRDDILSKITEDHHMEMLEQNLMLLELLFEEEFKPKEDRTRMLTELDCNQTIHRPVNPGIQFKISKMFDPLQ